MSYHLSFANRDCSSKLLAEGFQESVFSFERRIRILLIRYLGVFHGTVHVNLRFKIRNGFSNYL